MFSGASSYNIGRFPPQVHIYHIQNKMLLRLDDVIYEKKFRVDVQEQFRRNQNNSLSEKLKQCYFKGFYILQ